MVASSDSVVQELNSTRRDWSLGCCGQLGPRGLGLALPGWNSSEDGFVSLVRTADHRGLRRRRADAAMDHDLGRTRCDETKVTFVGRCGVGLLGLGAVPQFCSACAPSENVTPEAWNLRDGLSNQLTVDKALSICPFDELTMQPSH